MHPNIRFLLERFPNQLTHLYSTEANAVLSASTLWAGLSESEANELFTVPLSPGWIPPLRIREPSTSYIGWANQVEKLFGRSTHAFAAQILTQLLLPKGNLVLRPINLLWDESVPLPTKSTALFWLLHCESWPLISSDLDRVSRALAGFESDPGIALSEIFPPQTFVLPQMSHVSESTTHPHGYARVVSLGSQRASYVPISRLMAVSLSRQDRARFLQYPPQRLIYRPRHGVSLMDYVPASTRHQLMTGRFTPYPTSMVDSGYAHKMLQASEYGFDELLRTRTRVMSKVSVRPGLPTSIENLYAESDLYWRGFNCTTCAISSTLPPLAMTNQCDRIHLSDECEPITHVPYVLPRFWLGFTTTHESLNQPQANPHALAWVTAYLAVRPFALECLMTPHLVQDRLETAIAGEQVLRRPLLAKAGRLAKDPEEAEKAGRQSKSGDGNGEDGDSSKSRMRRTVREVLAGSAFTIVRE